MKVHLRSTVFEGEIAVTLPDAEVEGTFDYEAAIKAAMERMLNLKTHQLECTSITHITGAHGLYLFHEGGKQ